MDYEDYGSLVFGFILLTVTLTLVVIHSLTETKIQHQSLLMLHIIHNFLLMITTTQVL